MTELQDLLRKRWRKQDWAWKQLTIENTLFHALQCVCSLQPFMVSLSNHPRYTPKTTPIEKRGLPTMQTMQNRFLDKASEWVETWRDFAEKKDEQVYHQLDIIRTLVWCAEQAIKHPDRYQNEIDCGSFMTLADMPEFIEKNKTWAWVCIRTFLDVSVRRVEVPVVGWSNQEAKKREKDGFLATLVLEVIDGGGGQIAHYSGDVFCTTKIDEKFRKSMQQAWTAARKLVEKQNGELPLLDGRWRLLKDWSPRALERAKLLPAKEANDRSASGAAAWGWYFALQNKIPDERVIVLAQINHDGVLSKVDGVTAKVKAIARDGSFDTIAVTEGNYQEAEKALKDSGKVGEIRVKLIGDT